MNDLMAQEQELLTIDEAGKIVENRIPDIGTAKAIYDRLKVSQGAVSERRIAIQKQYDGDAPLPIDQLKNAGQSWRSNINPRENKAIIDLNATSIWEMFTNVPSLVNIKHSNLPKEYPRDIDYGAILAHNFTKILKEDWLDFNYHLMLRIHDMLLEGNGPVMWKDEFDWRSEAIKASNVWVPERTKSTIGGLDFCIVREELSPHFLAYLVKNPTIAKNAGWNVDEIKKALDLQYHYGALGNPATDEFGIGEEESLELKRKTSSLATPSDLEFSGVLVAHLFVKELTEDEGVSHYIFVVSEYTHSASKSETYNKLVGEYNKSLGYLDFLFDYDRQYKDMSQALNFLLFNIGDGYVRTARGLGAEIYSTCNANMRLLNGLLDAVNLSSGIMLKAQTASGYENLKLIKKGPMTVIPSNVDALQTSTFAPPIDAILTVRQSIQAIQNNNTGIYRSMNENIPVARTAKEVEMQAKNEARYESNQAAWYYSQIEVWYRETFRRLLNPNYPKFSGGYKEHKLFIDRCIRDGMPSELLKNVDDWVVTAVRNIGFGSPNMRTSITNEMMSVIGQFDEEGRRAILRDFVGCRYPWEDVDRYVPSYDRNKVPGLDHHIAESESVDMQQGSNRSVSDKDSHAIHLIVHAQLLDGTLNSALQGSDNPQAILVAFQLFSGHIQQHLQYLSIDPIRKQEVGSYQKFLQQEMDKVKVIQQQFERQLKEQQALQIQQQKQLAAAEEVLRNKDFEVEKYKIDKMVEVEKLKAEQLDRARQQKTATSMKAMLDRTRSNIAIEREKASQEIRREGVKVMSSVNQKAQKTQADIELNKFKVKNKGET